MRAGQTVEGEMCWRDTKEKANTEAGGEFRSDLGDYYIAMR